MKNWGLQTKSSLKNICSSDERPSRRMRAGLAVAALTFFGCGFLAGAANDGLDPVVVCVLDSGYTAEAVENTDGNMENAGEASQNAGGGNAICGWNFLEDTADITDEQGHGTDICTLIAGCAPDADIVMLKCFDEGMNYGGDAIVAALYAAVDDYQADVINMSWTIAGEDEDLYAAVQYAADSGAVLVASAGNLSLTTGLGSTVYPALWEEVIGVGGVDLDDEGNPVSSLWYLASEAVYVCARGDCGDGKGSSYAAARISGKVAAHLAENPEADGETVRQMLCDAALDLGESGYDTTYGWGYVETVG